MLELQEGAKLSEHSFIKFSNSHFSHELYQRYIIRVEMYRSY